MGSVPGSLADACYRASTAPKVCRAGTELGAAALSRRIPAAIERGAGAGALRTPLRAAPHRLHARV